MKKFLLAKGIFPDKPAFRKSDSFRTLGVLIVLLLGTCSASNVFAVAVDGSGVMTVSATSACEATTGYTFTFTFSHGNNTSFNAGSLASVVIPSGWTAPQSTLSGSPGYIQVTATGGGTASLASITGSGPWTITINMANGNGQGFTLTYGGGGTAVTTPSAGSYTFTTQTKQNPGTALTNIAAQPAVTVTAATVAIFSYTGTPYCKNASNPSPTFSGGGVAGTFSSTAGLVFVSTATGQVNLASSTAGTYTVTNTIAATGGCSAVTATSSIIITTLPVATFSYTGTPYCQNSSNPSPAFSGGGVAGTFTSTAGLVFIDVNTGQVDLASSTPGTYTVTNTIAAANGCAQVTATSPVTITVVPTASIGYAGTPFCTSIATGQAVTLTGTAAYTGGTYSSTAGLTINASTGAITPSTSTAGTYAVTYNTPVSGGCSSVATNTAVTITTLPVATFSYTGTPYCQSASNPSPTLSGSAGSFSSTSGLSFINASTGKVDLPGSTPGTYTITNTIVAANGCAQVQATSPITITADPTASISYGGTPFCKSLVTGQAVTLTGTDAYTGGTYTSTAGLIINSSTGAITPSTSTAGTYTVTYNTPVSGGCSSVSTTTAVTVTALPVATFSYSGSPYCQSASNPSPTFSGGGVAETFTSTAGLVFISASTGQVDLASSTPSTYTVTNTIAAANGCAQVTATGPITITVVPTASISYAGTPFCKSLATGQAVTLSGTGAYTAGTYSSTAGLTINASTGAITPSTSTAGTYTVTYTIPAAGGCAAIPVTTSVIITAVPTATLSYAGTPFCMSLSSAQSVTLGGTGAYTGGTYTAPLGLTIDVTTGAITPSSSTAGTYTVTYNTPVSGGCATVSATANITITAVPTASISYAANPFCKSIVGAQSVTLSGTGAYTGGTYSAGAGLTIVAATGAITPSSSTAGTYTVTYTIPASAGCAAVSGITTSVTITTAPTAVISYAGTPFCSTVATPQAVTLTGTAAYAGGTYSSTAGLSIDGTTGAITPSTSTAGTYTVTYNTPATGGCSSVTATTSVKIAALPVATFNYAGTPYCKNASNPSPTFSGGGVAGIFSSTAGLVFVSTATGQVNLASSTAGTYTVTNTIAATNGCAIVTATSSIVITTLPVATFSYAGSPYCQSASNPSPTFSGGGVAGTFTSTAGLVFINANTGQVDLTSSTPGTYTITNTIASVNGCAQVTATSPITVTVVPTASISYAGTPFCKTVATAQSVTISGTGAYTAGTYSAGAGLSISAANGAITPSTSTAGTYTVTYTIPASGGCAAIPVTTTAIITALPVATFSYAGTPYCQSASNPSPTFSGGGVAGTFTSTAGLVFINSNTGQVDLASSTPGTYTVTNTIASANGCAQVTTTSPITITVIPTASISYAGTPFCKSLVTGQAVTLTGSGAYTAGTYSSTAGLTINASTGAITPSTSTAGTYTVTYTIPASGGCAAIPVTTTITITAVPTATISYAGTPFCSTVSSGAVTLSGTGAYTGGTYTAPLGLTINASTGAITPNSSTAGPYTVFYNTPASGGCSSVTVSTGVTITALPVATFSYAGTPYCKNASNPSPTFSGGGVAGVFSSTAGLVFVSTATGQVNLASSTSGTYTVTNTIAAANGCAIVTATSSIIITTLPIATFSYTGTPYCQSAADPSPVFSGGGVAGTFTSTAGLVFISSSTGQVDLSLSTPGSYTVTNTIAALNGCVQVTSTSPITITVVPTASINYAGTPFCKSLATGQAVSLSGTGAYTAGTYSSTAGLTINASTGAITPSTSTAGTYTVTYTIPASGGCAAIPGTTSVIITAVPTAAISYAGTPFCQSLAAAQAVTLTGTGAYTAGTYSSTAGLNINSSTGAITPGTSTVGTYTITYMTPQSGGCSSVSATINGTITALPTVSITYAGTPFCKSLATGQAVTLSGTGAYTGGTYSSTAGLTINASTGAITPSTSTAGTYTVTYNTPASGGCSVVSATASVVITAVPTATISYPGSPFCTAVSTPQIVFLSGTGVYTAGTYTSSAGLTLSASSGDITPGTSTAGTYTVTYTMPTSGGCSSFTATTTVTVFAAPTASISYPGNPFCKSIATAQAVTITGTGAYTGGAYTSAAGLTLNSSTGAITPSTSTAGTYTITYTIPGCAAQTVQATVTISTIPVPSISYAGNPFCNSVGTAQAVTLSGTGAITGGTYSSTAGLTLNSSTGAVTPSSSTPGTYTITYVSPASGGCSSVSTTTNVTITALPVATFSYTGNPYSIGGANPSPTFSGGGVAGTFSSTAGLVFVSTGTGQVNLSVSSNGTYTVTNTISSSGCGVVMATATLIITADFRSKTTGNWNLASSWEIYNAGSWVAASAPPSSADGAIEIQSGHTITSTASVTVDQVTVDAGGTLTLSGGTLTVSDGGGTDIVVTGTMNINTNLTVNNGATIIIEGTGYSLSSGNTSMGGGGASITVATGGLFQKNGGTLTTNSIAAWNINSGATYRHNQDGSIIPQATWNANSTLEVTGVVSTIPTQFNQSFGHFTWNSTSQTAAVNLVSTLTTINGNFTMTSTGSGSLKLTSGGSNVTAVGGYYYQGGGKLYMSESGNWTMTVTGGFTMTAGTLIMTDGANTGDASPIINVFGNTVISGGLIDMSQYTGSNVNKGTGTMNVYKDFSLTSGNLKTTSTGVGSGIVNFAGTTQQNYIQGGTISNKVDFAVLNNAIVHFGPNILSGGRYFTTNSLSTIILGDANGITLAGASGNIQTTSTRTFSTNGLYTYNGIAMQATGNGLPSIVNTLTVDDTAGVTLTNSVIANYNLNMINGNIYALNDTLGLGFNNSNSGTLTRTTAVIFGYFKRWISSQAASGYLFPLGYYGHITQSIGSYRGMNVDYTATPSTGGYLLGYYTDYNPGTYGLPLTEGGYTITGVGKEGWWNLLPDATLAMGGAYKLDLHAHNYGGVFNYNTLHIVRRSDAVSPWTLTGTHAIGTGSNAAAAAHRLNLSSVYSQFDISSDVAENPLPIQLVDFTAKRVDDKVLINWKTASEVNNSFFTIERSKDDVDYTTVAKREGAGNSSHTNNYYALDSDPMQGVSFYRLRQTDFDGKETTFPPVAVNMSMQGKIIVFPNPSRGSNMFIAFPKNFSEQVIIEVSDLAGKTIFSRQESPSGSKVNALDPSNILRNGAYLVRIITETETVIQRVIVTD